jgi:hypothetical protein
MPAYRDYSTLAPEHHDLHVPHLLQSGAVPVDREGLQ